MSRCWALALRCGKFVVQQVVELFCACPLVVLYNMSVAGVRVVEFGTNHTAKPQWRTIQWLIDHSPNTIVNITKARTVGWKQKFQYCLLSIGVLKYKRRKHFSLEFVVKTSQQTFLLTVQWTQRYRGAICLRTRGHRGGKSCKRKEMWHITKHYPRWRITLVEIRDPVALTEIIHIWRHHGIEMLQLQISPVNNFQLIITRIIIIKST